MPNDEVDDDGVFNGSLGSYCSVAHQQHNVFDINCNKVRLASEEEDHFLSFPNDLRFELD